MTKTIKWMMLALLLAVGLLSANSAPAVAPKNVREVVKIGVILPLTGNSAHLGEPIRELIQYKVAHLPKDSRFEYKLVFEDDQQQNRLSLLAAHRLVELEKVQVLMTYFSGPGTVVAPYATQKKILHFMWNFKKDAPDGVYNFNHITQPMASAEAWVKEAKLRGYRKIACLVYRGVGPEAVLKAVQENAAKTGVEIVAVERFNEEERDFRVTLAKLREQDPDLLYVYAVDPGLPIVLRQIRELGWGIPVSTVSIFDLAYENPVLEGAWYISSDSPMTVYRKWFAETFKRKNSSYGSGVYDDYINIIYKACERLPAGTKPTGEAIAQQVRKVKEFDGACGKIKMNDKGVWETPPTVLEIHKGVVMPVE